MKVPPNFCLEGEGGEPGEERSSSSAVEMKWWVAAVKGREMSRTSRLEERKVWREGLSRPENHFAGMEPVGSPVPGTM